MTDYEQAVSAMATREAKREYQRRWRAANRDKVRGYQQRYWERKGQEHLQNLAESCKKVTE